MKLLVAVFLCCTMVLGQPKPIVEVKVKIESPELDKPKLLADLNTHGANHGLHFLLTESDYDYRITFSIGQSTGTYSGSTSSLNSATAEVYDSKGTEIFKVFRNNRFSESGVTNAVSKEVVKRFIEWQSKNPQN